MSGFSMREALGWLDEGELSGDGEQRIFGVSTDSRGVAPGELFVALRGERFDAHDFAAQACARGAAALLVERPVAGVTVPVLRVRDSRRALGELARGWRRRLELPVIGVVGSNGKTTVKEMLASILAQALGESARLATLGNLNGDIGVPLTVLGLEPGHRGAVIEMGMNHRGEIAWLAEIAQPTVVVVTNAQREHQEFLGSVRAVAIENGSAIEALPRDGVAVYPGDDVYTGVWRERAGARHRVEFGFAGAGQALTVAARSDAQAADFEMSIDGVAHRVSLPVEGRHNVRNALAAAAAAHACAIAHDAIVAGLAAFRSPPGRLNRRRAACGATLIDDSYNANPDSVRAAIDLLAQAASPRMLVLGDMGEVGEEGPEFHREIGAYAAASGIERMYTLGQASAVSARAFGRDATHFDTLEALLGELSRVVSAEQTVLVKGSRFMRMERVVSALAGPVAAGAS